MTLAPWSAARRARVGARRALGSLRHSVVQGRPDGRAARAADAAALTTMRLRLWSIQIGFADPAQHRRATRQPSKALASRCS